MSEPACQFFVARLQREELDGVGATGGSASCGKGGEMLVQGRQHVPGADEVVGLDHHPAELCEVLEGRTHVGEFGGGRRRRDRNGCRSQAGKSGGENNTAGHGHEEDPSVDASGDDDRVLVLSEGACPPEHVHDQGLRGVGPWPR
ncbi:hypothetical protein ACFWIN_24980 [Streptomyces sp. NPDC127049]|uniref:hypothetical protein n=1 Tax=Streptomyces sp. NPDC127049 TaxID=3347118 RepID=UPI0036622544